MSFLDFHRGRRPPAPDLALVDRKLDKITTALGAEERVRMALTQQVQDLVDQVAATRGAVDSQTALIKGVPKMIADAIAADRAANPSLTAEDFAALAKLQADLADEKTQVEMADALVTNPGQAPAGEAPPVPVAGA